MNFKNYKVVLFDLDGTLADRKSFEPYPYAIEKIGALRKERIKIGVLTNQGAPACHDAGWPFSDKFPDLHATLARVDTIALELGVNRVYICLAYQSSEGRWYFPSGLHPEDTRCREDWRKPEPGMILQAIRDFEVELGEVLMVGDDEEKDKGAAEKAGVDFMLAKDFFGVIETVGDSQIVFAPGTETLSG